MLPLPSTTKRTASNLNSLLKLLRFFPINTSKSALSTLFDVSTISGEDQGILSCVLPLLLSVRKTARLPQFDLLTTIRVALVCSIWDLIEISMTPLIQITENVFKLRKTDRIIGFYLYDNFNESIARIDAVLVDNQNYHCFYLVINLGEGSSGK
jgi:hypothetical protein